MLLLAYLNFMRSLNLGCCTLATNNNFAKKNAIYYCPINLIRRYEMILIRKRGLLKQRGGY